MNIHTSMSMNYKHQDEYEAVSAYICIYTCVFFMRSKSDKTTTLSSNNGHRERISALVKKLKSSWGHLAASTNHLYKLTPPVSACLKTQ